MFVSVSVGLYVCRSGGWVVGWSGGLLVCRYVCVLCWFVGVLVQWYVGVLVCWCVGVGM